MFIDPEEAQVRVTMIVCVDKNDIGSLRHSREYNATYRGKKYHFRFHNWFLKFQEEMVKRRKLSEKGETV
jgi:YHS domain-containing protein